MSTSIAKHPKVFSPTYIALIKSGEVGGVMDKVLRFIDNLSDKSGKVVAFLVIALVTIIFYEIISKE